jgi:hypothetical protein
MSVSILIVIVVFILFNENARGVRSKPTLPEKYDHLPMGRRIYKRRKQYTV